MFGFTFTYELLIVVSHYEPTLIRKQTVYSGDGEGGTIKGNVDQVKWKTVVNILG